MMTVARARFLATVLLFAVTRVVSGGQPVTIATVQFRVTEETFASVETFRCAVEQIVDRAVSEYSADIVIFPEYLNVFLIASRFSRAVEQASTVDDALRRITVEQASADPHALMQSAADTVSGAAMEMWAEIAVAYGVTIVGGTFFVLEDQPDGLELRNRLVVFAEDGTVAYKQDKVYLTDVERFDLGIRPGNIDDAEPVELEGLSVGFTICRDSFFDTWHEPLEGSELWVDLRANGERFSDEVRQRFRRSLPQRVRQTDAIAGVNATLTGHFLDLVWEGRSYAVDESGVRIAESRELVGTEITVVKLVPAVQATDLSQLPPHSAAHLTQPATRIMITPRPSSTADRNE